MVKLGEEKYLFFLLFFYDKVIAFNLKMYILAQTVNLDRKLLKFKLSMKTVIDSSLNYPFTDNSSSSTTKTKRIGLENAKHKKSKHTF